MNKYWWNFNTPIECLVSEKLEEKYKRNKI